MASLLEQAAAVVSVVAAQIAERMPEERAPDAATLAHLRSADRVYVASWWFGQGRELQAVVTRVPVMVQDAKGLWEYYEGLHLQRRLDLACGGLVLLELSRQSEVLARDRFPKLRRLLDVYFVGFFASCLAPKHVYYTFHRFCWSWEAWSSRRRGLPEPAPLPPLEDIQGAFNSALSVATGALGMSSLMPVAGVGAFAVSKVESQQPGSRWGTKLLAVSALGLGAAVWVLRFDGAERMREVVASAHRLGCDALRQLIAQLDAMSAPPKAPEQQAPQHPHWPVQITVTRN